MTGSATIRALVVDDDASVCSLHVRYLEALAGFTVVGTAATGQEAVDFVATTEVDLILLDMHLPDFSGIEVLHRLRSLSRDATDVIVVTSANEPVTVGQAAAARVADYLVKPFSRSVFELRMAAYRAGFGARSVVGSPAGSLRQAEIDGLLRPARPRTDTGRIDTGRIDTGRTDTGRIDTVRGVGVRGEGARVDGGGPGSAARLPKGLAAPTVALVLDVLRSREVSSVTDVADACGLARGTARRYLDFLRASGRAQVTHRYGVRGRPELLYSLAPG